jgi:hypothetical protein
MVALATFEDPVCLSLKSTEDQFCPLFENPAANVAHLSAGGAFPRDKSQIQQGGWLSTRGAGYGSEQPEPNVHTERCL